MSMQVHKSGDRIKVHALYLKILSNDVAVAKSLSFDKDAAVVDIAEDGTVIGFEFLAYRDPEGYSEFLEEVKKREDKTWRFAICTSMMLWQEVQSLMTALSKNFRSVTVPKAVSVATDVVSDIASGERWTRRFKTRSDELQTFAHAGIVHDAKPCVK